jgi:gas vesicle protein
MFSEATLLLGGIILFALGAIIGALIYHLIIHKFSNDIEKQLDKTIKSYENFVVEKAQDSLKEFEIIRNHFSNISKHIVEEQKSIQRSTYTISDNIDTFFRKLKESQQIRVSLENEIVKLKNIINRQNRQKKEK